MNLSFQEFITLIEPRRPVDIRTTFAGKEKLKLPGISKKIATLLKAVQLTER